MEAIAWAGSVLFAICGIPQAVKCYQDKSSAGLSWAFLLCWFWAEIFMLIYTIDRRDWPLVFNYVANFGVVNVMLYFKIWGKK
jgi:uncharacterized protein with PQ loop repeat